MNSQSVPPQMSPDGRWWWNGQEWRPASELQPRPVVRAIPGWIVVVALVVGPFIGSLSIRLVPITLASIASVWWAGWTRGMKIVAAALGLAWAGCWMTVAITTTHGLPS